MSRFQVERGDVLLSIQLLLTREEEDRRGQAADPRPRSFRPAPASPGAPATVGRGHRVAWDARGRRPVPVAEAPRPSPAMVDPLTGAGTPTALRRDIELARAAGRGPMAVVAITVQGLDQLRMAMGIAAGDAVLRALVEVAPFALRARDRIYRSGRDEMMLLLPDADPAVAQAARADLEVALGRLLNDRKFPELSLSARLIDPLPAAS